MASSAAYIANAKLVRKTKHQNLLAQAEKLLFARTQAQF